MGWACRLNPRSNCDLGYRKKEKEVQVANALGSTVKRFSRIALALLIAGAIARAKEDPVWLIFAPFINAVAKYLRVRFGLKYIPL